MRHTIMPAASRTTSPPPPLGSEASGAEHRRFVETGFPTESGENHWPGGFHPVHIDDTLKGGRYRIVRILAGSPAQAGKSSFLN